MRILHVTRELGSDRRFGMGRAIAPAIDALAARGHQLRYLTQDDLSAAEVARRERWSARLRSVLRTLAGDAGEVLGHVFGERLSMGVAASHAARQLQAEVVHLHDPWLALGFAWAEGLGGARRRAWGLTQHGFGSYTEAIREEGVPTTAALLRWQRRLEARVLRAARFVCCPTSLARDQLRRDLALPAVPAHWHVLPHALRPRIAGPVAPALPAGVPVVLAVGRLNPVKRMEAVVQAAALLQQRVHVQLLGSGDEAPLRQLLPADGRVTLDLQLVDDVAPWLRASQVYVSASRNESFGLANLEALACGTPAVCTAVGGVPEVTGGAAWLVPGGDAGLVDALAAAMRELVHDPELRRQWAARGLAHAERWPDADAVAQRHEAIYRTLA
ncbi:MAG: glycosyltransferase family 4 protein [Rubrivivax sp.]